MPSILRCGRHALITALLGGLFGAMLGIATASAQSPGADIPRESPPMPGPPRPFQLPTPSVIRLDNGLRSTFVDFGTVPKVTIAVVVRSGAVNAGDRVWLANMLADLLKEGTTKRDGAALATAAALMGGAINVSAGDDETSLAIDVLSEYAPQAIELLAEILTEPALPATELARIKQNYIGSLSIELEQPQSIADAAFEALLYPNHPYGRLLPTEAQLQSYTIEDLRSYYSANFGAQRTHVYVAGKFVREPIEAAIREHFGDWGTGPAPITIEPPNAGPLQVKLIDKPKAPQSSLRVGLRVIAPTHPDFMALSVMNTLLGGSLTSRITINLRENKGFSYSPRSTLEPKLGNAAWVEDAEVKSAATGSALNEIFKEIRLLQAKPPSEAELNAIKNYRNGIFVLGNASRFGLISQLAFMDLHGLSPEWLTSYLERMYAITPEQVMQSARTYIDPAKMSVVVVGDLNTVKKQLKRVPVLKPALPK